jgi:Gnt-I system low-affinity gluconate transporter
MNEYQLLAAIIIGIAVLLILILRFKVQAFLSLLISSIIVGIIAGMNPNDIINTMKNGMASTLGTVATIVGLGAMFGAILESSGGAQTLANFLLKKFGEKNASWALMLTGFFVAIPVFFDVAFIILIPLLYSLQRRTKKSLLLYAIPLLAGLAITHSFIPPTPGPVAVADILKADLGWVILVGFIVGIPTAVVSGPLFAKYISKKIHIDAPELITAESETKNFPSVGSIVTIIGVPIVLIVLNTVLATIQTAEGDALHMIKPWLKMIGHPFSALIIANLLAWYFLGIRRGFTKDALAKVTSKSMEPAGIIILLTGAGGVFKQILINTGIGKMLADQIASSGISLVLLSFIIAALVRILQGSATVAMITAAGVVAPLMSGSLAGMDKAFLVISIAAGASILSHVNDSGFWLVSKFIGMNEQQTFKSWTVMTVLLSLTGFTTVFLLSLFF